MEASLPMRSAIDAREERFSSNPVNYEQTDRILQNVKHTKHVVYASPVSFVIFVQT